MKNAYSGIPERRAGARRGTVRSTLLLAVMLGLAGSRSRAEMLTFPEALSRLRSHNGTIQAAAAVVAQREEERAAARGLYLPRIEAEGSATRIDDPLILDLGGLTQVMQYVAAFIPGFPLENIPHLQDQIEADHFQRAEVTASWPLFTGGRIRAANRAADARLDDSRESRRQTEESLTTDLARCFFGLRLTRRALAVRTEVEEGLAQHLVRARQLAGDGRIAEAERLHAELAHSAALRERQRAQRDVVVLRAGLSGMLAAADSVDAASPLFVLHDIEPLEHFLELARGGNSDLSRLEAQRRLASAEARESASAWFPDVYLFGQHELRYADLTVLDPRWTAGIGARWTVFDGGARWHNDHASREARLQVDAAATQAQRDVESLVTRRYEELRKQAEDFASFDSSLAAARENLRLRMEAFAEGKSTSTEVTDAANDLSGIRLERLGAAFCFDVVLAELLEACGASGRFEEYRNRPGVEVEAGS